MKTALVSGGSRGIGAAIVRRLSENGYTVAFLYHLHDEKAKEVASSCHALAIRADVKREDEVNAAVKKALDALGHIDLLVNNAGVCGFSLFTELTTEDWHTMLATHLDGAFYLSRAVLPDMIHRQSGKIVNISSMWGQVGASCEVHYSTAKAGLIGFTKALAKEVGPSGITVNCIAPGVIDTDMNKALTEETKAQLCEETPLGRIGTPDDIASALLFLAQEGGDFMTGQVLGVNGGFVI